MNEKVKKLAEEYFGQRARGWKTDALAERLAADGFEPRSFLAFAFRHSPWRGQAYENEVTGPRMYDAYKAVLPELEIEADVVTRNDFDAYEGRRRVGATPRQLLSEERLPVSPLFKYAMSMVEGFYDIAMANAGQARVQVAENPYYIKAWPGELLRYFPAVEEEVGDAQA